MQISLFETDQSADAAKNLVVDPLSIPAEELSLLKPFFESDHIVKIFHSSEDDVKLIKKDMQVGVSNIFDTHLAAKYLGKKDKLSLQALVQGLTGYKLDKKWQKADWRTRPMEQEQLDYAVRDTVYLNKIRLNQIRKLKNHGTFDEFTDHCQRLGLVEYKENFDLEYMWVKLARKSKASRDYRPHIKALYNHRLKAAQAADKSAFRIIPDTALLEIAQELYERRFNEENFRGYMNSRFSNYPEFLANIDELWPQIDEGYREDISDYPYPPGTKLTPSESKQLKNIQEFKNRLADKKGIDASLIFSKKRAVTFLKAIINNPQGSFTPQDYNEILGWSQMKLDIYKEDIEQLERQLRRKYSRR